MDFNIIPRRYANTNDICFDSKHETFQIYG